MPRNEDFVYANYGSIPAGGETAAVSDDATYKEAIGFIPDADGTLAVVMADGSTPTLNVKGGGQYAGAITKFKQTGTNGVTTVTVLY